MPLPPALACIALDAVLPLARIATADELTNARNDIAQADSHRRRQSGLRLGQAPDDTRALYNLACAGELPRPFALVGTSTSVGDSDSLRQRLGEAVSRFSRTQPRDEAVWSRFAPSSRLRE